MPIKIVAMASAVVDRVATGIINFGGSGFHVATLNTKDNTCTMKDWSKSHTTRNNDFEMFAKYSKKKKTVNFRLISKENADFNERREAALKSLGYTKIYYEKNSSIEFNGPDFLKKNQGAQNFSESLLQKYSASKSCLYLESCEREKNIELEICERKKDIETALEPILRYSKEQITRYLEREGYKGCIEEALRLVTKNAPKLNIYDKETLCEIIGSMEMLLQRLDAKNILRYNYFVETIYTIMNKETTITKENNEVCINYMSPTGIREKFVFNVNNAPATTQSPQGVDRQNITAPPPPRKHTSSPVDTPSTVRLECAYFHGTKFVDFKSRLAGGAGLPQQALDHRLRLGSLTTSSPSSAPAYKSLPAERQENQPHSRTPVRESEVGMMRGHRQTDSRQAEATARLIINTPAAGEPRRTGASTTTVRSGKAGFGAADTGTRTGRVLAGCM